MLFPVSVPSSLFTSSDAGKAFPRHVISSKNNTDVTECTKLCLVNERCKSLYFSEKKKQCELSGSKADSQVEDNSDFYYYERAPYKAILP